MAEAKSKLGNNAWIVVGIDTVNEFMGTGLRIDESEHIAIAAKLAQFLVHAEEIEAIMKSEITDGRSPDAGARITIEEGGSLTVCWRDRSGIVEYKRNIQ